LGEVIDLMPRLAERRAMAERKQLVRLGEPEPELVRDLLDELEATREDGLCETCTRYFAVAEVFRSDALDAGLGSILQCRRCLSAELGHNRSLAEAKRAEWVVSSLLGDDTGIVRLQIDWDISRERASAVDGICLG
jgi:hypothetical protein